MSLTADQHLEKLAKRDDANKPTCLLHTCCAPCSTSVFEELLPDYKVTGFYYNPNIHPITEFRIRRDELIEYSKVSQMPVEIKEGDVALWFKTVGNPSDFEEAKSSHCYSCYTMRLEETARFAKANGFEYFATVLSVSPHKVAEWLNEIGNNLARKYDLQWVEANFKKKDGYKRSVAISKALGLYRQDYCGCVYSMEETAAKRKQKELDKQEALLVMSEQERQQELERLALRRQDALQEMGEYHQEVGLNQLN